MADIVWKTVSLPDAVVGKPYEAGLASNGAATAVTASAVVTGALPAGIVLNADHVRLTGTPTQPAGAVPVTYTFTLSMTDTAGAVTSGTLTITVHGEDFEDVKDRGGEAALTRKARSIIGVG